jgi:hypothetical protein
MKDKDTKKTLTFVLVAGMAVLVAWEPWRPAPLDTSVPASVGQKLFPDFSNPLAAKSLEIVKFNEETASIRDFKVAQTKGLWSIPSHSDYPADAKEHMAEAATALMDLKILGLASDRLGDQKEYGVITPDPAKLKVGMTGVGTRITVKDGKDNVLADLVVGKQVKNQPGQHYVRRADKDQIYTVGITTDKLSTKFDDWIEKDLLKLAAFDVREVELNDYSSQAGISAQGRPVLEIDKRNKIKLDFDDAKSQWSLVEMNGFDEKGQPQAVKLAEDEELNTQKLNDLKTALDDLQIVDVERKPKGLSQDLRASDEFLNNAEAMQSLGERGFIPVSPRPGEPREIYSNEGEVTCTTKEGVRYVLRFGSLAGGSTPEEKAEDGKPPKSAAPNRYLFVMAQFDDSQIPKPELQKEPGDAPPADDKGKPADDKPAAEKPSPEKPATEKNEKTGVEAKPAAKKPADKQPAAKPALKRVPETKTADDEAQDAAKPAEKSPPTDSEPENTKAPDAATTPPAGEAKEPAEKTEPAEKKPVTPEEEEKLAIERENKRKQDDYDTAVKRGQDKVKELNDRFADWYFIISDDVYKKIHLGRNDIIKKKEAEKSDAAGDLKGLEKGIPIGPGAKGAPQ